MDSKLKSIARRAIPILKKNGVVKAGIFGSYAQGKAKKTSDIDILVKVRGNMSLLDIVRLERELRDSLKRKVDVVEYVAIHPYIKKKILREEVPIL